MDSFAHSKLTALQREILDAFFDRERGFFLRGSFLERAGYAVEAGLPAALAKDGGCTPATLAWLLSEVVVPDGANLPGGVAPDALRTYVSELVTRLLVLAAPA